METTERIVEAFVRSIKGCATIPNIRCAGQFEIDLLAIHPLTLERYHIESGVSISGPHSKLTGKAFSVTSGDVTDEVIMQYIATQDLEERARDGDFTFAP